MTSMKLFLRIWGALKFVLLVAAAVLSVKSESVISESDSDSRNRNFLRVLGLVREPGRTLGEVEVDLTKRMPPIVSSFRKVPGDNAPLFNSCLATERRLLDPVTLVLALGPEMWDLFLAFPSNAFAGMFSAVLEALCCKVKGVSVLSPGEPRQLSL